MASVSPASPLAPGELRRAAGEIFDRAERERDDGNLEEAARLFGRAAGTWRASGEVMAAADAYIELGTVLLRQGRGGILPELAARLLALLEGTPPPEGARLNLRVFAALMTHGAANRDAFLGLVQERRLGRHRAAVRTERRASPG
ncbi:MAG: hypothetical protein ABJC13_14645 [Acidobacteriota bacterium]